MKLALLSKPALAGFPSPAADFPDEELDLNTLLCPDRTTTFFLRARGDALAGSGILDGDLLILNKGIAPQHGDLVVYWEEGGFAVRKIRHINGQWRLGHADGQRRWQEQPLPPHFDALLWGVVVGLARQLRRHTAADHAH
ncbi:LexA family protein [Vogesella oryzae]|uniref:LexA family protein n=1 Tax=Vogesella oryzae TaxID=1735285 RepID=UPI0015814AA7|nr:S24 family peptidase [Vogesella oryzae]